jgi:hypothetical protein
MNEGRDNGRGSSLDKTTVFIIVDRRPTSTDTIYGFYKA